MIHKDDIALKLAHYLLQIKAIQIQTPNPFQWASGWLSPIYCDNRKTLSHPNIRNFIKKELSELIRNKFSDVEIIAGVATGAIAVGALIADELDLPFIYIRSSSKGHGLGNQIEGDLSTGKKVVVVEDLVSTGMSSLNAVDALRAADMEVLGMVSIFNYGFDVARDSFEKRKCHLYSLSDYDHLLKLALEEKYVKEDEMKALQGWRKDPQNWKGL
jgi:orotate phosphoribosyltransferase